MADESKIVNTREKTIDEVDEMFKWFKDNNVSYNYLGNLYYQINDPEMALMVQLKWG
jgi:hypothetical protein